jgi:hypothetical protein
LGESASAIDGGVSHLTHTPCPEQPLAQVASAHVDPLYPVAQRHAAVVYEAAHGSSDGAAICAPSQHTPWPEQLASAAQPSSHEEMADGLRGGGHASFAELRARGGGAERVKIVNIR